MTDKRILNPLWLWLQFLNSPVTSEMLVCRCRGQCGCHFHPTLAIHSQDCERCRTQFDGCHVCEAHRNG